MANMINVTPETHELARKLSLDTGVPMRELVAAALEAYSCAKEAEEDGVVEQLLKRIETEVDLYISTTLHSTVKKAVTEVITDARKQENYKPWLKRDNADDVKEIEDGGLDTDIT